MADKVLNDTSEGILKHVGNELLNDSTVLDPPAYRGGAPAEQRSLVKFSGDILLPGGTRQEVVLQQFKQTENAQNQLEGRGGEYYLGLAREGAGTTDAAMVDALTATVKDGFRFRLPVYAPNLNGASSERVTRFYTDNGDFLINLQDDGGMIRMVFYRVFYKPDGTEDHVEPVGEKQLWP